MTAVFLDRVSARALTFTPAKVVLTLLALPFYLVGLLVGGLWVAVAWCLAAGQIGMADVRARAARTGGD